MSILDDAIREHLELKRQHGADEAELKRLEDEAFGPPGRPDDVDPFAEAPTEFMAQPEAPAEAAEEKGGRRINIADLQEPPPPKPAPEAEEAPASEAAAEPAAPEAAEIRISHAPEPPQGEAPPIAPAEDAAQVAPPAEEEPPAMEHEVIAEPPAEGTAPEAEVEPAPEAAEPAPESQPEPGHSTEERHAIAEQPTEFFDIEAEMGTEDAPAPEAPSPSDEEIAEAEHVEPRLVPVGDEEDEEDEEFWSDQRLSDELDQALESPVTEEHDVPAPAAEPTTSFFDQDVGEGRRGEQRASEEEPEESPVDYDPDTGHEDVLEDTPEFLEDAPEDDDLWFEQRPPKDFDFDD